MHGSSRRGPPASGWGSVSAKAYATPPRIAFRLTVAPSDNSVEILAHSLSFRWRSANNSLQKQRIEEETMDRRAFLGVMAAGVTATALKATAATTERPLGETGVPLQGSEPLPLGPLPGGRYPDS